MKRDGPNTVLNRANLWLEIICAILTIAAFWVFIYPILKLADYIEAMVYGE